jgi:hypothetical protein
VAEAFGTRIAKIDPAALLQLERAQGRSERFAVLDELVGDVLQRALRGEYVIERQRSRRGDSAPLQGVERWRELLDTEFAAPAQQARGAWFLPDAVRVRLGKINFAAHYRTSPDFGGALIDGDGATVALGTAGDALFAWAVLDHFFETMLIPIEIRTRFAGGKTAEEQAKLWARFDSFAQALGFDVDEELEVMRFGGGWHTLTRALQVAERHELLRALGDQADEGLGARYRALRVGGLVARYYAKAKNGRATRRQVMTRAEERTLAGFFGGDWLRFLDYLGEEPAAGEEIITALPEPRLYVGGSGRVAAVAAEQQVPLEEVERILAALWQGESTSPVEARVGVLKRFWASFDGVHARQSPGMPSLWGLTEEGRLLEDDGSSSDGAFTRGLYQKLLPSDLIQEIEQFWLGSMIPRWPDRIVSSLSPIETMANAFGPALRFWHGAALTAWFVCEGPMSRTDMAGLAEYHAGDLDALERLGAPIDRNLFEELKRAEAKLPAPEPVWNDDGDESEEIADGISISVRFSDRSRREGFESLRDIITRYRRSWAEQHLDSYLREIWQDALRQTAREYSRFVAEKGKAPTAKQFAKTASPPANQWFGGDLSALYAAIAEKSPVKPERCHLLPSDRTRFAQRVFAEIGGKPLPQYEYDGKNKERIRAQNTEHTRWWRRRELAEDALRYVQLHEALGEPPTMDIFGKRKFEFVANEIWGDADEGWRIYERAVATALATPEAVIALPPPPVPAVAVDRRPAERPSLLERLRRGG